MERPDFSDLHLPDDYFIALGRFYHEFTVAEIDLTAAISLFATQDTNGTKYDVIKALLGGTRMKPAKDTLSRILRVTGQPEAVQEHVSKVFHQLGEIQYLRDRLAHNNTSRAGKRMPTDKAFINTGIDTYREWDKVVAFGFDLDALEAATSDLGIIPNYLSYIFDAVREGTPMPPLELPAWRYKPSMLDR